MEIINRTTLNARQVYRLITYTQLLEDQRNPGLHLMNQVLQTHRETPPLLNLSNNQLALQAHAVFMNESDQLRSPKEIYGTDNVFFDFYPADQCAFSIFSWSQKKENNEEVAYESYRFFVRFRGKGVVFKETNAQEGSFCHQGLITITPETQIFKGVLHQYYIDEQENMLFSSCLPLVQDLTFRENTASFFSPILPWHHFFDLKTGALKEEFEKCTLLALEENYQGAPLKEKMQYSLFSSTTLLTGAGSILEYLDFFNSKKHTYFYPFGYAVRSFLLNEKAKFLYPLLVLEEPINLFHTKNAGWEILSDKKQDCALKEKVIPPPLQYCLLSDISNIISEPQPIPQIVIESWEHVKPYISPLEPKVEAVIERYNVKGSKKTQWGINLLPGPFEKVFYYRLIGSSPLQNRFTIDEYSEARPFLDIGEAPLSIHLHYDPVNVTYQARSLFYCADEQKNNVFCAHLLPDSRVLFYWKEENGVSAIVSRKRLTEGRINQIIINIDKPDFSNAYILINGNDHGSYLLSSQCKKRMIGTDIYFFAIPDIKKPLNEPVEFMYAPGYGDLYTFAMYLGYTNVQEALTLYERGLLFPPPKSANALVQVSFLEEPSTFYDKVAGYPVILYA